MELAFAINGPSCSADREKALLTCVSSAGGEGGMARRLFQNYCNSL